MLFAQILIKSPTKYAEKLGNKFLQCGEALEEQYLKMISLRHYPSPLAQPEILSKLQKIGDSMQLSKLCNVLKERTARFAHFRYAHIHQKDVTGLENTRGGDRNLNRIKRDLTWSTELS